MSLGHLKSFLASCKQTRLALASALGPFGVHLLKFTLTTPVHRICDITRDLHNLSQSLKSPVLPITSVTLSPCRSFEAKDDWTFSRCFHGISFCSRVYMNVRGMPYLHHEVHEFDGISRNFGLDFGIFFEMCSPLIVASTSHVKVPSKAPHSSGLSRTSSKTYIFLSHYRAANRIKPLVARCVNGIVT